MRLVILIIIFFLDVPAGFFKLINNSKYATYHKTNPQKHLKIEINIIPQGNVLGGGTSINAQVYMRGRAEDYNEWHEILRVNNDNADGIGILFFHILKKWKIILALKINIIVKKEI